MKKKLLGLLGVSLAALVLGACTNNKPAQSQGSQQQTQSSANAQTFTVAFEVDGTRFATSKVKEGQKITDEIGTPQKEGFDFAGWYDGDTKIDLAEYIVTKNVTLTAKFEEKQGGDPAEASLKVDDVKEAGKEYYLVLGWWEVKDDANPDKKTSYLTPARVRVFYANLIKYLKASGATDDNIAAISFRDYSSAAVADMGAAVNADGDVDLLIGVGNNINSTAGVSLYDGSNDSKFATQMSVDAAGAAVQRYCALTANASELGVSVYSWLKTDTGKKSFLEALTDAEISASLVKEEINLKVIIHGTENVETVLTAADAKVTLATFNVPEGHHFAGYSLTQGGEVALNKGATDNISYSDVKNLVAAGSSVLDLYPVFEEDEVATDDLVVYVQTNNITNAEVDLLAARFNDSLSEPANIRVERIPGNADAFTGSLDNTVDVVVGGNNPLSGYTAHADGALVNAGAKHFANTSRRVLIRNTVSEEHLDLAKAFYNFVKEDAQEFEFYSAIWHKNNTWLTVDEIAAVKASVEAELNSYLAIGAGESLLEKYNVKVSWYEATNTLVANLGQETLGLREGKGPDLLIGCGANVTTTGQVPTVEIKDIPTSIVAAGRKVAIIRDNGLVRHIFDVCFSVMEAL